MALLARAVKAGFYAFNTVYYENHSLLPNAMADLSSAQSILNIGYGILASVILPGLSKAVKEQWTNSTDLTALMKPMMHQPDKSSVLERVVENLLRVFVDLVKGIRFIFPYAKPYIQLGLFSFITGVVVFVFMDKQFTSWQQAFAAGYLWDSTLQKIKNA